MSGHPPVDDQDSVAKGHSTFEKYFTAAILVLIVVIAIAYGLASGSHIIGFEVAREKGAGP